MSKLPFGIRHNIVRSPTVTCGTTKTLSWQGKLMLQAPGLGGSAFPTPGLFSGSDCRSGTGVTRSVFQCTLPQRGVMCTAVRSHRLLSYYLKYHRVSTIISIFLIFHVNLIFYSTVYVYFFGVSPKLIK